MPPQYSILPHQGTDFGRAHCVPTCLYAPERKLPEGGGLVLAALLLRLSTHYTCTVCRETCWQTTGAQYYLQNSCIILENLLANSLVFVTLSMFPTVFKVNAPTEEVLTKY